jgi:hypothetical protein
MDNIKTKDRDNADLDIAAKDVGGVLIPRNILTKPDGTDIEPLAQGGTVELGSATLAALENTTVELGATSLAALESVTVGGTVELGATSLAALENTTVELGATSLAALESVSAVGPLTDAELRATPVGVVMSGVSEADPLPVHDESAHHLLLRLLQYLNAPQGYDKSLQRARVTAVLESGTVTTVTTVAAVTAVTSLNNFDGYNARMPVLDTNRTAWAQCVRSRIT